MRSYSLLNKSDATTQPRAKQRQERTVLSSIHVLDSWNAVEESTRFAKSKKKWTTKELQALPTYIPGLPLSTEDFTPEDMDPTQHQQSLQLVDSCLNENPKNSPLPTIKPYQLNFHGQEQLFTLLPKYISTNSAIIIKAAYDALSHQQTTDNSARMHELLETAKKVDILCKRLHENGVELLNRLAKVQKMGKEIDPIQGRITNPMREKKFLSRYRALQLQHGHIHDEPIPTGSYFDLLTLLQPHIQKLAQFQEEFHEEAAGLSRTVINNIQETHAIFPKEEIQVVKKSTAMAIAIILTTFASAYITATQYNSCSGGPENNVQTTK